LTQGSRSFDLYGGLLLAGFVSDNAHPIGKAQWPKNPEFWTGNPLKALPANAKTLTGVVLSISSFKTQVTASGSWTSSLKLQDWSGLHVGVWLCWGNQPYPKEHDDVFAFGNTGDSGACNIPIPNLSIPILTPNYTIGFWAHNMRPGPSDWHTNGVLYFETQ